MKKKQVEMLGYQAKDGTREDYLFFSRSTTIGEKRNTQNYLKLPYNSALRERARELRKAGNLAEVLLWLQLKNKQMLGMDFDRQKIIGNYIVDFYCANIGLVVEVDGSSHDNKYEYDTERDNYLEALDLIVIHFSDFDVKNNGEAVLNKIKEEILSAFPSCGGVAESRGGCTNLIEEKPPRPTGTPPQEGNGYTGYKT